MSMDGYGSNPYWDDTEDGKIIDTRKKSSYSYEDRMKAHGDRFDKRFDNKSPEERRRLKRQKNRNS